MRPFYSILITLLISVFAFLPLSCSHGPEVGTSVQKEAAESIVDQADSALNFPKKTTLIKEVRPEDQFADLSMHIQKYQLPNGLKVILVKNDLNPIISIYVHYGVGSKHETAGMTGASHFLEHMMFKGAKKFGLGAFDKVVESNGGSNNAYTSADMTVYHEHLPAESLKLMLEVEADRMQNLLLEEKGFISEKNVVLEERKLRYENSPEGQKYAAFMQKILKDTPYEVPVIGSVADIKRVTRDEVYQYFKNYYAPNNAVIVVAGKLDFSNTIDWIEDYFSEIPPSLRLPFIKEARENPSLYTIKHNGKISEDYFAVTEDPMFVYSFPALPYGDPRHPALEMLSLMLGGGMSSLLEQKYVKGKNPRLSQVYTGDVGMQHAGIFIVGGKILPGVDRNKFYSDLESDLKNFCKTNISQGQIDKFKNILLNNFYSEFDTNRSVANILGSEETSSGDFLNLEKRVTAYANLGPNQISQVCEQTINLARSYRLTLWNKFKNKMSI
jgi:zinc protease